MKIKNLNISTTRFKKTNHDLNWKSFKTDNQKSCNFGPLHLNKVEGQVDTSTKKPDFIKLVAGVIKDEDKIKDWINKLKKGYVPATHEMLEIQTLVYENNKKLQLMSKLIETLQSTLKRLKQTQI